MKTRLLVLVAVLPLLAALAACGNDTAVTTDGAASPSPLPSPEAAPKPTDEATEAEPDDAAPIVVRRPAPGEEVTSPMTIAGDANVFEATVSLRLVTADGEVLAEDFTTATCGSGCRGDYRTRLRFEVSEPTEAALEVFESSAEDGSPLHMVRIPITLLP